MSTNNEETNELLFPIESFSQSLSKSFDVGLDFAEATLDMLIDNDIVRNIPILKTILAGKDIVVSLSQKHEIKKIIMFLGRLNTYGNHPSIAKMQKKILENNKYLRKESELTLIVLEKFIEDKKSIILADLFFLLVDGRLSQCEYEELVFIVNQIHLGDISILKLISNEDKSYVTDIHLSGVNRLVSTGVVFQHIIDANGVCYNHYQLTSIGEKLVSLP